MTQIPRPGDKVENRPNLPDRCLGYGCELWALKSSLAFAEEFFDRVELEARHGGRLPEMALMYASLSPLEEIAGRYDTKPEHLLEQPAESPHGTGELGRRAAGPPREGRNGRSAQRSPGWDRNGGLSASGCPQRGPIPILPGEP